MCASVFSIVSQNVKICEVRQDWMVCTSEIWIDIKSTNLRRTLFCILVPLAIIDVQSHQTDVQKQPFFKSFEDRVLHWHPLVLSLWLWRCQAAEWDKHEAWHGGTILLLMLIFHVYPLLRFDVWKKWQLHLRTKTTHTPHFVFNYQLTCRVETISCDPYKNEQLIDVSKWRICFQFLKLPSTGGKQILMKPPWT